VATLKNITKQIHKNQLKLLKKVKLPIRQVILIPFLLQIFVIVGLTGWLSWRNGQRAVNELATELKREISAQIEQKLMHYLDLPHNINQINVNAINLGILDLDNIPLIEKYLTKQIQLFTTLSYIGFGRENGEYVGASRSWENNQTAMIDIAGKKTAGKIHKWQLDDRGERLNLVRIGENLFDPRKRPWYKVAVEKNQPVWTDIYSYFTSQELVISANQPFFDKNNKLLGVASADFTLSEISIFLSQLKIGKTGQTFVIDKQGNLIATSVYEKAFDVSLRQKMMKIPAINSTDPLTRAATQFLQNNFVDLKNITKPEQLVFKFANNTQYVQITPLNDQRGIDWLIVIVVPEKDFMEAIEANTRITIFLCILALLVACFIGLITSRLISQPILELSKISQSIASGNLDHQVSINSITTELNVLARSFRLMSQQLQASFQALADANQELEQKVIKRTAELSLEKEKSEQLLLNILPRSIADRLKEDHSAIASAIDEVTILFADIVGFTPLASYLSPIELVNLLNEIFSQFDALAEKHGLEKIKTIGDAYMVVGGLPIPRPDHAEAIARMALDMQTTISKFQSEHHKDFRIRIGINTGPVVAGVIGIKKFIYDLWGDTVNVASRMESHGEPGEIQITQATYEHLEKTNLFIFAPRGKITIKGKGEMTTYWLKGKKSE
jgi:class 3 adenylate cyclase/HAMP domain-containing protein